MRLIDADNLNFEGQNYNKSQMKAILDFLDNQPTAYDVDKVVEQLESPLEQLKAYVQEYCNECDCEPKCSGMQALDEIRKIVKAGGTDE